MGSRYFSRFKSVRLFTDNSCQRKDTASHSRIIAANERRVGKTASLRRCQTGTRSHDREQEQYRQHREVVTQFGMGKRVEKPQPSYPEGTKFYQRVAPPAEHRCCRELHADVHYL